MASTSVTAKTVVIADDTAFVRDRFRAALESAGHKAIAVKSAAELLARVRADLDQIDLIVLDLRLPHAPGVDLVRSIRKLDDGRLPILVFSGTIASADEVRELAALGVAGYVNEYSAVQHILPSLAPHLFPDNFNRRGSPRVVLGIPIQYRFGNTIAAALTLNLSHGGIAIRTTSPLDGGVEDQGSLPHARLEEGHRRRRARRLERPPRRHGHPVRDGRSRQPDASSTTSSTRTSSPTEKRKISAMEQSLAAMLWRLAGAAGAGRSPTGSSSPPSSRSSRCARRASIS